MVPINLVNIEKMRIFLNLKSISPVAVFVAVIILVSSLTFSEDLSPPKNNINKVKHALNCLIDYSKNGSIYFTYDNIKIKKNEFHCLQVLISYILGKKNMSNTETLDSFIELQRRLHIPRQEYGFFGPKMISFFETQLKAF